MKNNYSSFEKLYYQLSFSDLLQKVTFDINQLLLKNKIKKFKSNNKPNIIVSGMARSGTTALLNYIFSSQDFAALTYNDMPFVLAPKLSRLTHTFNAISEQERSHNDGILISARSPEAFDEVFFRVNKEEKNISELYSNYIKSILILNGKTRYLSKNNNLYKHLKSFDPVAANTRILVPFRCPLSTATSLLNQHKNYLQLHRNDNFILKYMNFLGHYEFGLNHQPWFAGGIYTDFCNINYWLEQWIFYYNFMLKKSINKNVYLICYEKLSSKKYIEKINGLINFQNIPNYELINKNKKMQQGENINSTLLKKADNLYHELLKSNIY